MNWQPVLYTPYSCFTVVCISANEAPTLPQHTEKGATGLDRALNIGDIDNDKKLKC